MSTRLNIIQTIILLFLPSFVFSHQDLDEKDRGQRETEEREQQRRRDGEREEEEKQRLEVQLNALEEKARRLRDGKSNIPIVSTPELKVTNRRGEVVSLSVVSHINVPYKSTKRVL